MKSLKQILSAIETLDAEAADIVLHPTAGGRMSAEDGYQQPFRLEAAADALRWVADATEHPGWPDLVTWLLGESCDEVPRDTLPSRN